VPAIRTVQSSRVSGRGAYRNLPERAAHGASKEHVSWGKDEPTEARVFLCRGFHLYVHHLAILFEDDVVELANLGSRIPLAEEGVALKGVGKGIPALGQRLRDLAPWPDGDVEDPHGGVREVLDGVDTVALARDDLDGDLAVVRRDLRDLGGAEVAVAGLAGLEVLGEVDPELQAYVGGAVGVLAGHLGVHYPAPGGHELQVAGVEAPRVAGEIFVVDAALEEVGDGLLAAVWTAERGSWSVGHVCREDEG
jgi:hypothetical protein